MSTTLIPIAISSQLDVTGEERIHAAKYMPSVRPVYVAPPVLPYFAWQLSEDGPTFSRRLRTGYASFDEDTNTFSTLATFDLTGVSVAKNTAGVNVDGKLVMHAGLDQDGAEDAQLSGVYLLNYDGTSVLAQEDLWQISGTQYHEYVDLVKYDDDTVISMATNADDGDKMYLHAINYAAGTLTTAGTPLMLSTEYKICMVMHNGFIIVHNHYQNSAFRSLKAYSWNGSTFSLVSTYGGTITTDANFGSAAMLGGQLVSDGNFIYLGNGQIFTFDGAAFTLVTTVAGLVGVGSRLAVFEDHVVIMDGTTDIRVYDFDGASTSPVQTLSGTWATYGRAFAMPSGCYLVPAPDAEADAHSGVFTWDGAAYTRVSALEVANNNRATDVPVDITLLSGPLTV